MGSLPFKILLLYYYHSILPPQTEKRDSVGFNFAMIIFIFNWYMFFYILYFSSIFYIKKYAIIKCKIVKQKWKFEYP